MKVGALQLKLGRVAAEPIPEAEKNQLAGMVQALFGESTPLAHPVDFTLPLDDYETKDSAVVHAAVVRAARDFSTLDRLLVDMRTPAGELIPDHHVVTGLVSAFEELILAHPALRIVVSLTEMLSSSDISMRTMSSHIEGGRLGIIDNAGVTRAGSWLTPDAAAYAHTVAAERESRRTLLQKKMIRRVGHFPRFRDGTHDHCVPFFFDGTYCKDELVSLVAEYVSERAGNSRLNLFFHCEVSRWLQDTVVPLGLEPNVRVADVSKILAEREDIPEGGILLVVPLVDSGDTVRNLTAGLEELSGGRRVSVLSVMTAREEISDTGGTIDSAQRDTGIPYDFLLSVSRERVLPESCPACASGVPFTDPGKPEPYQQLTAQAAWWMILQSGLKNEDDVPARRPSLGRVPDFPRIVEANAPYLAYKLERLLANVEGKLPANPVLVCPEEAGAEKLGFWLEELKSSLESLFNFTLIRVPREVLDAELTSPPPDAADMQAWLVALSSLRDKASRSPVILMDEFNASGGTRRSLKHLVRSFGLEVLAYVALADFAPTSPSVAAESPILALYEFPLVGGHSPEVRRPQLRREPPNVSSRFLLELLRLTGSGDVPSEFQRLLSFDLAAKSRTLPSELFERTWREATEILLPGTLFEEGLLPTTSTETEQPDDPELTIDASKLTNEPRKIEADIVIVTVIPAEFEATLKLFGIEDAAQPVFTSSGYKFFETRLSLDGRADLSVWITMVGEARNLPCAMAVRDINEQFEMGACLLVGIAGGNSAKTKYGDVVGSRRVFDLEGGRSEVRPWTFRLLQRFQPRIQTYRPPAPIRRFFQNLDARLASKLATRVAEEIETWRQNGRSEAVRAANGGYTPAIRRGGILAGEKILANGRLPRIAKKFHDKIYAVDMEGSGFAHSCEHCQIQWLVFRGVSDLGDPKKADDWHHVASIAAATAARLFLETEYRRSGEDLVF